MTHVQYFLEATCRLFHKKRANSVYTWLISTSSVSMFLWQPETFYRNLILYRLYLFMTTAYITAVQKPPVRTQYLSWPRPLFSVTTCPVGVVSLCVTVCLVVHHCEVFCTQIEGWLKSTLKGSSVCPTP